MVAPGPLTLGRGVVINAGDPIPAPWAAAPVVVVDDKSLESAGGVVGRLHEGWGARQPIVVELAVDPTRFRAPESYTEPLWALDASYEPWFDRLHFLVWNNTYDARGGTLRWWWGAKAARLAEGAGEVTEGPGDVRLADGSVVWVDGGPRRPWSAAELDGLPVVHHESVELGSLAVVPPPVAPTADLASDQLAAVAHLSGPARIIAPAGSGKTRVLTERLRHLLGDRGYERETVIAVAYNKQAQLELEGRTTEFAPRVRTLNSLGLWILGRYHGSPPRTIDERDVRSIIDKLAPGKRQRRANTDPIGPYVEALSQVRLGLQSPGDVESWRDDVPGFAGSPEDPTGGSLLDRYREVLAERGVVDFDEQIYGAIEVLLRDGSFRREMQQQCRHLLVDEFQDLTQAHILLVRLLALPALDVFGVGDDDQVIYGHASADPRFLIDFADLFPGAVSHPLTVNYRCPVPVVDAARTLLGYNDTRVAKEIVAGPAAVTEPEALRVVRHETEAAASTVVDVVTGWLAEPGVAPTSIAVLARVNSLLLPPHLALHEAGVPLASTLHPDVLERTGLRAALAYLRIASTRDAIDPRDVVEILRRPSRGLPQWFPDRLQRRTTWTIRNLRGIADQVPDKEAVKVGRLVDDLDAVVTAGRGGTTRLVLETVRDRVGLGSAMGLLDQTGGGQSASHLDDLEGLIGVADLHDDPAGFEPWLRAAFQREADPQGVTLSTVHRVKGREWPRVVVFGVVPGIVPHRLAEDVEEERRVLHVAITRGRERVAVLTDRAQPSPFLAELDGSAPKRPKRGSGRTAERDGAEVVSIFGAKARRKPAGGAADDGVEAAPGVVITALGGYEGSIEAIGAIGAQIRLTTGGRMMVKWGERVEHDGRKVPLIVPTTLHGRQGKVESALREYRTKRSKADGMPAYHVLSDKHLRGVAIALPTSMKALAACDGIGPAKLEKYGDDILAVIDEVADPA